MENPFVWIVLLALGPGGASGQEKKAMPDPDRLQKLHQHFSASCFNLCWEFIDKADRTPEDMEDMMLVASASLWHWKQRDDCKPLNLPIGTWQMSRVYTLAGQHDLAKSFGERCLKVSLEGELPAFYPGYAYEALARAEIGQKQYPAARGYLEKADAQLADTKDKDEQGFLWADLDALRNMLPSKLGGGWRGTWRGLRAPPSPSLS